MVNDGATSAAASFNIVALIPSGPVVLRGPVLVRPL
jgi:hypothetical protein